MDPISRKRPCQRPEDADYQSRSKRQRASIVEPDATPTTSTPSTPVHPTQLTDEFASYATAEAMGRGGMRRSITLALQHVGFDSATEEALEGFTEIVETYMAGFIEQVKRIAHASRRSDPTPTDFEDTLRRHNLALSSLKPHLKNPVAKDLLEPKFCDPIVEDTTYLENPPPVLGDELDGRYEKEERPWIPQHFPSFPSKHTYRYTPAELPAKNTHQKRAEAVADARKGEVALRRIDRAAKITRHKELREVAQRHSLTKKRHEAWEGLMKNLLSTSRTPDTATEVADHSTIVNAGANYGRKELPRTSRRAPVEGVNGQT